nr:hypothetical protein [Nitrososphaerota archaeon]
LSDEVLMPDLPPPYTIGEANVEGLDVSNKVKFVGFITPNINLTDQRLQYARSLLSLDHRPLVLMQISGPSATRKQLAQIALESSNSLVNEYNVVISMGEPGGSTLPRKLSNNTWIFDWCPIKDELFSLSNAIVARSGHGTISQCINSGKPAVYVPISNHSEQIWNAEKCERLGIGLELRSELSSSKKLIECVETCLKDSRYVQNVEKLREISRQHNGLQNTIKIIRSYL